MSKAFEEIAREATELSRKERLDLASLLLELNDGGMDADVSAEWEQEVWHVFGPWMKAKRKAYRLKQ